LEKPELESLRDEIDQIDEQVVSLLNNAVRAAAEIGKIKHEMGVDPYDPSREEQVFEKIEGLNEGSVPNDSLRAIYREVFPHPLPSKRSHYWISRTGSHFTHQAAMLNFGSALSYRSLPDIPDVFQAVEKGECDYGVVPIENSTEGAVNRSLDLLVDTELTIIAQVYLKIEHCLFSPSSLDKIVEVRSKDQALAQCGEWLRRNLPNARLVPVTSTAEAVRESAEGEGIAAIAGKLAGEAHGVPMLDSGIQDRKDNVTRFLVVSRNPSGKRDGVSYRTSLVLSLPDQVGALQSSLNPFSSRGINLCKIESRPSKRKTWDYFFFVDFLGHAEDEDIRDALNEVSDACPYHRILGSYPETQP
jgi:chorismate mutase/prephenate dehydratase